MRRERAALSRRRLRPFRLRPPAVSASIQPKLLRTADLMTRSLHDLQHGPRMNMVWTCRVQTQRSSVLATQNKSPPPPRTRLRHIQCSRARMHRPVLSLPGVGELRLIFNVTPGQGLATSLLKLLGIKQMRDQRSFATEWAGICQRRAEFELAVPNVSAFVWEMTIDCKADPISLFLTRARCLGADRP
jgi:hypothetical protein